MLKLTTYLLMTGLILIASCSINSKLNHQKKSTILEQVVSSETLENLEKNKSIKQQYVAGSDDIPLFNDLEQIEDDNTSFDTTSGNIVISSYTNKNNDPDEVRKFYLATMPQLGWELVSKSDDKNLSYKRNGDTLEISFEKNDQASLVKFFISSSTQN